MTLERIPLFFLLFSFLFIPVLISRPWSQKSWFQSWYQDSRFESLDSCVDIQTQVSKVLSQVSLSRLKSLNSSVNIQTQLLDIQHLSKPWDCLCKVKITRKCNSTSVQNARVRQTDCYLWTNVAIWCPVGCWISFNLFISLSLRYLYILWLKAPPLTHLVCWHHWISLHGMVPHLQDSYPESLDYSPNIKIPILKGSIPVSIPVLISRLHFQKSWYQPRYQD